MLKKIRDNISLQIFIGLVAGILLGLFLGDRLEFLKPVSSGFVQLMQMTILPYVIVSTIRSIGSLKKEEAKNMALKLGTLLLLFWGIISGVYYALQFAFPNLANASFYSNTDNASGETIDLVSTFIPSNPFNSMANGAFPAVVLFCIFIGIALISIPNEKKHPLMEWLDIFSHVMTRITDILIHFAPLGVLVMTAYTVGTIQIEHLVKLEVFFVSLIFAIIFFVFVIFPTIISWFTPFKYGEIIRAISGPLILAISSNSSFVTIPLITETVIELFKKKGVPEEEARACPEIAIPAAYNFPTAVDFAPLLFILFSGWYYNAPLSIGNQVKLLIAGIPSFFGSPETTIPFLLRLMKLPSDAFDMWLISYPIHDHFQDGLGCMYLFAFTMVATGILTNRFHFNKKHFFLSLASIIGILAMVVVGLRILFTTQLGNSFQGQKILTHMDFPLSNDKEALWNQIQTVVYKEPINSTSKLLDQSPSNQSQIETIRQRGILRVGYLPEEMPFSFFNSNGKLVGLDVQNAYDLAGFLGVEKIEFIPIDLTSMSDFLNSGNCDIIMAGISISEDRLRKMKFTNSYLSSHLALIVPDEVKSEYSTLELAQKISPLRIAAVKDSIYPAMIKELFPNSTSVELQKTEDFFTNRNADVLLINAEEGADWTLLYPFFDLAVLETPARFRLLYGYPVAFSSDDAFLYLLNTWLKAEKDYGEMQEKYEYWVEGKNAEQEKPRWSILSDVFNISE